MRETLLRAGIVVSGRPVDVDDAPIKPAYDTPNVALIATHQSPTLAQIVEVVNKESHNLYAEQILKTLGAHFPQDSTKLIPGSAGMGIAAEMATFVRAGIDTSRIQLVDGSGLSRMNLITAEMTGQLLSYAWHHPNAGVRNAFLASLPVGGADGTLEDRFGEPDFGSHIHAKTGTVSNASTLSGYLLDVNGKDYSFVLMSNHFTVKTSLVRDAQDAVVRQLSKWK